MFKTLTFNTRKPGMSMEEYIKRYEEGHAPLAAKYLANAVFYSRRYVTPQTNPTRGGETEIDFDSVTELWFNSREDYEAAMAYLSRPDIRAIFSADEEALFDRDKIRLVAVEEFETKLPKL